MYYPDDKVEEVLRSNNIVDVVGTYVHLQKKGANYFGLCPFHNEKSPSFSVSESKQMFYCFGCGAGGNAATFLMKYENYSFREALETLADRAGIKLPEVNYGEEAKKKEEKQLTKRLRYITTNSSDHVKGSRDRDISRRESWIRQLCGISGSAMRTARETTCARI